jgi:copper chaperone
MKYSYSVADMSCGHCKMHIENALKESGLAKAFSVDLPGKRVEVESDSPSGKIVAVIAEAGYTAVEA